MKKLVVIFPGAGYGLDCPLLYYADFLFETKGYERVHMKYLNILSQKGVLIEEKIKMLREYTWNKVKDIDFDEYQEVIFLSKSIGAIEAGVLSEKLGISVKHIFLTPVEDATIYLKSDSVVVIGTEDKAYERYKSVCEDNNIKALYIKGADHSLEIYEKPFESIRVLEEVLHFVV